MIKLYHNNNTEDILNFVRQAALYVAESRALSIEDALSIVYNSDTFRLLDENKMTGLSFEQLLDTFKREIVSGKIQ